MSLSPIDRKILNGIQEDIPLCSKPFKTISDRLGIKESEFLEALKRLKDNGMIRNFAARVSHKKLGFKSTLIALRVPEDKVEPIAKKIAKCREVTHCYLRDGEYNLWTVFICDKEGRQKAFLKKLSKKVGKDNVMNLSTRKQFKLKTKFDL